MPIHGFSRQPEADVDITEPGSYTIKTHTPMPFDEAVERTREALKSQGFGVLTEIDVRKTMQEKLGEDFRPYIILGACNPPLAHQAFKAEIDIGALLPCNVIVYEEGEGSVIAAMNPEILSRLVDNIDLRPVAEEVAQRLKLVIEDVAPRE